MHKLTVLAVFFILALAIPFATFGDEPKPQTAPQGSYDPPAKWAATNQREQVKIFAFGWGASEVKKAEDAFNVWLGTLAEHGGTVTHRMQSGDSYTTITIFYTMPGGK